MTCSPPDNPGRRFGWVLAALTSKLIEAAVFPEGRSDRRVLTENDDGVIFFDDPPPNESEGAGPLSGGTEPDDAAEPAAPR